MDKMQTDGIEKSLTHSPFASKWYVANKDNAKVAHDDVDALTAIEDIVTSGAKWWLNNAITTVKTIDQAQKHPKAVIQG